MRRDPDGDDYDPGCVPPGNQRFGIWRRASAEDAWHLIASSDEEPEARELFRVVVDVARGGRARLTDGDVPVEDVSVGLERRRRRTWRDDS